MVSAFANTTFTFETDPALNFELNDKCQTDGRGRHNTITMWITQLPEIFMVVKILCFPAAYLEALSTSMSSNSQWKNNSPPPKKHWRITRLRQSKNVSNQKSKLQLKCFMFLKSVIYLGVSHRINCIDLGQWPLNTAADFGGFPYWFSVMYWLAEWCCREYSFLNSFIQMKYILAQIKIIINSYSLMAYLSCF